MLVDVRATSKLRGDGALDVTTALQPVIAAACDDSIDLSRLRIVCDWIQYRSNFRDVVDVRELVAPVPPGGDPDSAADDADRLLEIAVDLRRSGDGSLVAAKTADALAALRRRPCDAASGDVLLEPWKPMRKSCIWEFNRLYWQALQLWERSTGRMYESALPGGASDARNIAGVRELIGELFDAWDRLVERDSLPAELYVVELGVGNGSQAKVWLDEFVAINTERGRDYDRRLHYLMCDYSPHVLELARKTVVDHDERVSSFVLDATRPTTALSFLRFKVFLVYVSNVYDNLPTDEVARLNGMTYLVETRARLPAADAAGIAGHLGVRQDQLADLVDKLLRLGPTLLAEAVPSAFPAEDDAVEFWQRTWTALRLSERYVPVPGLDLFEIAPGASGELLRPLLESGGDLRMQVSNGAVASFVDTLPLLHPYGRLQCHDLFATSVDRYRTAFSGPGKYDGSVVNWVNGPLLAHIGRRKGFDVRFAPFAHRAGSNVQTMTAQVRD